MAVILKIARDCGFGLYPIDLLLERARLHLLEGNPPSALEDLHSVKRFDGGLPLSMRVKSLS